MELATWQWRLRQLLAMRVLRVSRRIVGSAARGHFAGEHLWKTLKGHELVESGFVVPPKKAKSAGEAA